MNVDNKNKLYEFEKIAIIVVLVLVVVIGAIVVSIATSGNDSRDDKDANSELVIQGTSDVSEPNTSAGDSEQDGGQELSNGSDVSMPQGGNTNIKFDTISVDNSMLSEGELLLVNQDYEYRENIEDSLVNVYTEKVKRNQSFVLSTTTLMLRLETIDALCNMLSGFNKDTNIGTQSLMITNTYVDVDKQQSDYEAEASKLDNSKLPYLQAGGESEHHTGLAFHMVVYPNSQGKMGQGSYEWFVDNCWKYGFVLRYPEGKEDRTQSFADDTHFRYVGIPHAACMNINQWVLEDYLEFLQDRTSFENRKTVKDSNGVSYEVYAVRADDGEKTNVPVPAADSGWSYTITGANNGYFVVTIKLEK